MTKEHTGRRWELLAALGVAWWLEELVTLEWSYPYCSVRDSGLAAAVFGFPLPYDQASIVTSATHFFIPWLYLLNIAFIASAVFLMLRPLASIGRSKPRLRNILVGAVGAVLLTTAIALDLAALSMGVWRPTSSFDGSPRFSELRPVSLTFFRRHVDCTASPFWFPNQAQRVNSK